MVGEAAVLEAPDAAPTLERLRDEIEQLDAMLIQLIGQRVEAARSAGRRKRAEGLPAVDPAREAAVVRRAAGLARSAGLPEEDVRDVFWRLIAMSRRVQTEVW